MLEPLGMGSAFGRHPKLFNGLLKKYKFFSKAD